MGERKAVEQLYKENGSSFR
ncbi:hypothetical protein [Peribacillus sp. NPDC058075]